jgi:hypothetical protein
MSCDKLVFDLAQEIEGGENVFVKKDWINILDNQNQNYNSNQSVVDTSQLSNSNKYLSYRESYFLMPLLLTLSTTDGSFSPNTTATTADYAIGLKNWFGSIIHSFTLDYNGTTIIQQTPYINMWNAFKLMTSLSWNDVITQGSTIGFYPDDPLAWGYNATARPSGIGVFNNTNNTSNAVVGSIATAFNTFNATRGNVGLTRRQQYINFDLAGAPTEDGASTYATLFPEQAVKNLWKSYICKKQNNITSAGIGGLLEIAVSATVYLKHIHSFFSMTPLLKGVFMKMTMNLNNTVVKFGITGTTGGSPDPTATAMSLISVSNPVGGVCPLMIASAANNGGGFQGSYNVEAQANGTLATYTATLSVGGKCLDGTVAGLTGYIPSPLAQSVYLYVPAYTFNPVFEQAYLSSPVKQIKYTDVYQYQVLNISAESGQFNNLLTNGIASIKSILVLPFYSAGTAGATGLPTGLPVYQSPFDPAGCGPTSPLTLLTNFNVVVSGQNAIYNTERYSFEQFNNQLYGQNAVNGGMTDGLTSSLINSLGFEMEYCYYYVNVSRMLPVEESVPKSVQIIGTNSTGKALDLWCFIEYGVDVSIDILSGARV